MFRDFTFNGEWITTYFRTRWATERNENPLKDLMRLIRYLTREEAASILNGNLKIETVLTGHLLTQDTATQINGLPLRWETSA